MKEAPFQKAYEEAAKQLRDLLLRRSEMDTQIAELKNALQILGKLTGGGDGDSQESFKTFMDTFSENLSRAVKALLRFSGKALTPVEIKEELTERSFDFAEYSNPGAAIHAALKRLVDSNEVIFGPEKDGKTTYLWNKELDEQRKKEQIGRVREIQAKRKRNAIYG